MSSNTRKCRGPKAQVLLAASLAAGFCSLADGATFAVSWDGGATGSYNTAVNWSTNTVPINADVLNDYFNVTINRVGGTNVTANLSQIEVLNLTIGANAGNQLTLADNCTIGVIGTAAFGPTTVGNSGTIQVGQTAAAAAQFNFLGSTTSLTGGGTISLIGANTGIFGNGTVTSNNTIIGFGEFGLDSLSWVSTGTVTASGGSLTVDMDTGGFDNNGLMQSVAGGTLVLSGNGGGSFANGGGTIANNGGRVNLIAGATIAGGNISSQNLTGSSIFFVPGGQSAALAGVTSTADVNVGIGATLSLSGTITNNGRMRTNNSAGVATFNIGTGTVTLSGAGSLALAAVSVGAGNLVGAGTLVNSASHSIFGAGTLGNGSTTIRNDGLIDANVAGATLTIRPELTGTGGFNTGTIQASSGTLVFAGGTWTNSGAFIKAESGAIALDGVRINGGSLRTLDLTGTSVIAVPAAGSATLSGVTSFADIVLNPTGTLHLDSAIGNNGRIRTAPSAGIATFNIGASTIALNGNGSLALSESGLSDGYIVGSGTLVNGANHSIVATAGEGTLGDGATSLRNNGTISLPNSVGALNVVGNGAPAGVVNAGTMSTSSPVFFIRNANVSNSGTIQALSGGAVRVAQSTVTGGTIQIASGGDLSVTEPGTTSGFSNGTLIVNGNVGAGNGVTLQMQSMFVQNNGVINIGLAGAADSLQFTSGTTTFSGSGVVVMGLGSIDSMSGNGTVDNQGNLFSGTGTIGLNDLTFINDGTILVSNAAEVLNIDTGAGGLTNTGVIRSITGGAMRIRDTAVNNTNGEINADTGNIELFNNTSVSGGTLNSGTALIFVPGSSTATLMNLTNNALVSISSGAVGTLVLGGSITNQGEIRATGNAAINVSGGTTTLGGSGSIALNNSGLSINVLGNGTLVNGSTHRIVGRGNFGGNTLAIRNLGTIDANFAGGTLTLDPGLGNVNNSGTLAATVGTLVLTGAGGGVFSNTGTVSAAGGTVLLTGGVNVGPGTIRSNPGSQVRVESGQTGGIAGATNLGDIVNVDGTLTLNSVITNNGTIGIGGGAAGATVSLLGVGATFNGTGRMTLGVGGFGTISVAGSGTLTNGPTHLISGRGSFGSNDLAIVNSGTISANLALQTLVIDPDAGNLVNAGTIQAVSGGTVHLVGGNGGVFNNTGTLRTSDQFSRLLLIDATVNGGTLDGATETSNFLGVLGSTGTINNAANVGLLSVVGAGTLNVGTALTNSSHVFLQSNPGGAAQVLLTGGTVNFSGAGSVQLSQSGTFESVIAGSGTLTSSTRILGRGALGSDMIAIRNTGTISASVTGATLRVDPGTDVIGMVNSGTMLSTAGAILELTGNGGGTIDNSGGLIQVEGAGTVLLTNNIAITGGTLSQTSSSGRFQVPADEGASLGGLQINSNLNLTVQTNGSLTLGGAMVNNGLIQAGGGGVDFLTAAGTTTLSGTGSVVLGASGSPSTLAVLGRLENNGNTIRGFGSIGNGTFVNAATGVVDANVAGQTLSTMPGTFAAYENSGLMRASNGGTLMISQGFFVGPHLNLGAGSMLAADNSTLHINNATVIGGSLHSTASGTILLSPLARLTNLSIDGRSFVGGSELTVGSLVTNNGPMDLPADSELILSAGSQTTFRNTSTMTFATTGFHVEVTGVGTLINDGTMTGGFDVKPDGVIHLQNAGLIEAIGSSGVLLDTGVTGVNGGTLRAVGGSSIGIASGAVIGGAGTIDLRSTSNLVVGGDISAGTTLLDGKVINAGTASLGRVNGSGTLQTGFLFTSTIPGATTFTHARVPTIQLVAGTMITSAGGGTAGTSRTTTLSIAPTGKWDLTDHDLVVDYTVASPLPTVLGLIQAGHAGGSWNGAGLTSSSAAAAALTPDKTGLGYAEAGELFGSFPQTFSGQTIDSTTVLIKYTLLGDANLNGGVDIDDFGALASNFNTTGRWNRGDFNYSGTVDIDDFGLLAANFNKSLAGLPLGAGRSVPEPGMTAFALPLLGAARRRRWGR